MFSNPCCLLAVLWERERESSLRPYIWISPQESKPAALYGVSDWICETTLGYHICMQYSEHLGSKSWLEADSVSHDQDHHWIAAVSAHSHSTHIGVLCFKAVNKCLQCEDI